jgi:ABC-type ATPase involved in cell division
MPERSDPLLGMLAARRFEPYIDHIRFPHFRNLRDGTRINFEYPVTVLVGPNGTNKTAILRALQGCPDQFNIGLYWFSTDLDPIAGITPKDRHRFIYGYFAPSVDQVVEVVKSRIASEDPDYFEPARPILADGMERMPPVTDPLPPERTRTRWRAIKKPVIYLDFRSELSAFDKFFYQAPFTKRISSLVDKKKIIRQRSHHLALSLDGRASYKLFQTERIISSAQELKPDQVAAVSRILGREYDSIKVLYHRFFNVDGYSVILRGPHLQYSEAFAGSGEFAVTMLVRGITEAPDCSLILLDEPEVSLHPGAQRGLMDFIREQAKLARHQFVISTHAPEIVRDLPSQAIKVFQQDPLDGKIELIAQASSYSEAFFRLGVPTTGKRRVYVEDALSRSILNRSVRLLGEAAYQQLEIQILPGGAGTIQTRLIPSLALSDTDCLIFLDGDQRVDEARSSAEIPDSDLAEMARRILNGTPQLSMSGGIDGHSPEEEFRQLRAIIEWVQDHVTYLPGEDPESLLLDLLGEERPDGGSAAAKREWEMRAQAALGRAEYENVSAADILQEQERALAKIASDAEALQIISDRVQRFLR